MTDPFVGEILLVGFNFAPTGFALCDGRLMPIAQNTALFSILGTFHGAGHDAAREPRRPVAIGVARRRAAGAGSGFPHNNQMRTSR